MSRLVPACLAVVAIHRFDSTDPYSDTATYRSVVNVLTYTWNQYALEHVFEARGDLGHLWYLSVQQQCYLLLPLLIVFSRRRLVLGVVLTLAAVAVVVNRFLVLAADGWFPASLMTTTRSDGLILGVVAALAIRYVARWRDWADRVALLSTVLLLGLLLLSGEIDPLQYLRHWGVAFTLVSVVLVCALHYARNNAGRRGSSEPLPCSTSATRPSQYMCGTSSSSRPWLVTPPQRAWQARSVLAFALLAGATYVAQRLIEDPTRRWLKNSPLFRAPIRLSEEGERGIGSEIR